jgi:hypothetical protein
VAIAETRRGQQILIDPNVLVYVVAPIGPKLVAERLHQGGIRHVCPRQPTSPRRNLAYASHT